MSLCSLYTRLLCLIFVIAAVSEYHLLSNYYVSRTLFGAHNATKPLLLYFPSEDSDTRDSMSVIQ